MERRGFGTIKAGCRGYKGEMVVLLHGRRGCIYTCLALTMMSRGRRYLPLGFLPSLSEWLLGAILVNRDRNFALLSHQSKQWAKLKSEGSISLTCPSLFVLIFLFGLPQFLASVDQEQDKTEKFSIRVCIMQFAQVSNLPWQTLNMNDACFRIWHTVK